VTDERLNDLLDKLDGRGSDQEFNAIHELSKLGDRLPSVLLGRYRSAKKWQVRCSCVYHAISYSRDVDDAVQLGIEALSDKSKVVRYRSCMLLAYSLKKEALPALQEIKLKITDTETPANVNAAIDAIENQNSNFFVDRHHTGKVNFSFA
jgi:HEAT repeat protein